MGDEIDHVGDNAEDAGNDILVVYPDPRDEDFDDIIGAEERQFYVAKYNDLASVVKEHLHCTACDRHLGASVKNSNRLHVHPMLRTLVCKMCLNFYNSGEFEKGEDGSELYCRWCGQGGEVLCCSSCPVVFCAKCIKRNCGAPILKQIQSVDDWYCFKCSSKTLWPSRATCWALLRYCALRNKYASEIKDSKAAEEFNKIISADVSQCCQKRRTSVNNFGAKRKSERNEKHESEVDIKPKIEKDIKNNGELNKIEAIPVVKLSRTSSRSDSPAKQPTPPPPQPPPLSVINLDDVDTANKEQSNPPAKGRTPIAAAPKNPMDASAHLRKLQQMNPSIVVKSTNAGKPIGRPRKNPAPVQLQTSSPAITAPVRTYNRRTNQNSLIPPTLVRQIPNDNLNLSLDSLTQGLDLASLNAMTHIPSQSQVQPGHAPNPESTDDVVCTPDLPMPMEEPEEVPDDQEDDVQCMTPNLPKLVPKPLSALMEPPSTSNIMSRFPASAFLPYNITSLTTDDVTINRLTGGLKFKIDPNTLNSNKMYRLPDGRIFAITPNPATPGGFSATIVTMSDSSNAGAMTANPLTPNRSSRGKRPLELTKESLPEPKRQSREKKGTGAKTTSSRGQPSKETKTTPAKETRLAAVAREARSMPARETRASVRETRLRQKEKETKEDKTHQDVSKYSLEWYKYNLTDALDVVEYIVQRLNKVKSTTVTPDLKSKSKEDITTFRDRFDQILKLACKRITEVRSNLDEGYHEWLDKTNKVSDDQGSAKSTKNNEVGDRREADEDDDDVEIISDDTQEKNQGTQRRKSSEQVTTSKQKPSNVDPLQIEDKSDKSQEPDIVSTKEANVVDSAGVNVDTGDINADDINTDNVIGEAHDVGSPVNEILGPGSPGLPVPRDSPVRENNSPAQLLPDDGQTMAISNLSPRRDSPADEPMDDCVTESDKFSTRVNPSDSSANSPLNEESIENAEVNENMEDGEHLADNDNADDNEDELQENEEDDANETDEHHEDTDERNAETRPDDRNDESNDGEFDHDVDMVDGEDGANEATGDDKVPNKACMNGKRSADKRERYRREGSKDASNDALSCENSRSEDLNSSADTANDILQEDN